MSAPERVMLLQDVFTSWGSERCDKLRLLAESFSACPQSVAFLVQEENEKGAKSPIKYTWMATAAFRKLDDELRLRVLKRFASGTIVNTEAARSATAASPLVLQALQELDKVCYLCLLLFLIDFFFSLTFLIHFFLAPRGAAFFSLGSRHLFL
jgi:hypothetical protein